MRIVWALLAGLLDSRLLDVVPKQMISDVVMVPLASVPLRCGSVIRRSPTGSTCRLWCPPPARCSPLPPLAPRATLGPYGAGMSCGDGAVIFIGRALSPDGASTPVEGSWLARTVYFTYPIGDPGAGLPGGDRLFRVSGHAWLHLMLVSVGMLICAVADTVNAYQAVADSYTAGSIADLGCALGYGLFTLAALAPGAAHDPHQDDSSAAEPRPSCRGSRCTFRCCWPWSGPPGDRRRWPITSCS